MEISRVEAIHCSKGHANVLERASEVRHKRASGGRRRRRKMWKLGTGSWAQTGTAAGKRRNGNAERHFQFGQRLCGRVRVRGHCGYFQETCTVEEVR
jgi:hypothetical protein